jgi:hypothetical protein
LNIEIPALIRSPNKKEEIIEELKDGLDEYESKSVTIIHEDLNDKAKTIDQEVKSDHENSLN